MIKIFQWLALAGLACLCQADPIPQNRNPRLLTTTTTSTVITTTASLCYTTTAAVSTCARKKRALINNTPYEFEDMDEFHQLVGTEPGEVDGVKIQPSAVVTNTDPNDLNQAMTELEVDEATFKAADPRNGRAFIYFYTTTTFTPSTSYSTTTTVTLGCTPSSSILSICG